MTNLIQNPIYDDTGEWLLSSAWAPLDSQRKTVVATQTVMLNGIEQTVVETHYSPYEDGFHFWSRCVPKYQEEMKLTAQQLLSCIRAKIDSDEMTDNEFRNFVMNVMEIDVDE